MADGWLAKFCEQTRIPSSQTQRIISLKRNRNRAMDVPVNQEQSVVDCERGARPSDRCKKSRSRLKSNQRAGAMITVQIPSNPSVPKLHRDSKVPNSENRVSPGRYVCDTAILVQSKDSASMDTLATTNGIILNPEKSKFGGAAAKSAQSPNCGISVTFSTIPIHTRKQNVDTSCPNFNKLKAFEDQMILNEKEMSFDATSSTTRCRLQSCRHVKVEHRQSPKTGNTSDYVQIACSTAHTDSAMSEYCCDIPSSQQQFHNSSDNAGLKTDCNTDCQADRGEINCTRTSLVMCKNGNCATFCASSCETCHNGLTSGITPGSETVAVAHHVTEWMNDSVPNGHSSSDDTKDGNESHCKIHQDTTCVQYTATSCQHCNEDGAPVMSAHSGTKESLVGMERAEKRCAKNSECSNIRDIESNLTPTSKCLKNDVTNDKSNQCDTNLFFIAASKSKTCTDASQTLESKGGIDGQIHCKTDSSTTTACEDSHAGCKAASKSLENKDPGPKRQLDTSDGLISITDETYQSDSMEFVNTSLQLQNIVVCEEQPVSVVHAMTGSESNVTCFPNLTRYSENYVGCERRHQRDSGSISEACTPKVSSSLKAPQYFQNVTTSAVNSQRTEGFKQFHVGNKTTKTSAEITVTENSQSFSSSAPNTSTDPALAANDLLNHILKRVEVLVGEQPSLHVCDKKAMSHQDDHNYVASGNVHKSNELDSAANSASINDHECTRCAHDEIDTQCVSQIIDFNSAGQNEGICLEETTSVQNPAKHTNTNQTCNNINPDEIRKSQKYCSFDQKEGVNSGESMCIPNHGEHTYTKQADGVIPKAKTIDVDGICGKELETFSETTHIEHTYTKQAFDEPGMLNKIEITEADSPVCPNVQATGEQKACNVTHSEHSHTTQENDETASAESTASIFEPTVSKDLHHAEGTAIVGQGEHACTEQPGNEEDTPSEMDMIQPSSNDCEKGHVAPYDGTVSARLEHTYTKQASHKIDGKLDGTDSASQQKNSAASDTGMNDITADCRNMHTAHHDGYNIHRSEHSYDKQTFGEIDDICMNASPVNRKNGYVLPNNVSQKRNVANHHIGTNGLAECTRTKDNTRFAIQSLIVINHATSTSKQHKNAAHKDDDTNPVVTDKKQIEEQKAGDETDLRGKMRCIEMDPPREGMDKTGGETGGIANICQDGWNRENQVPEKRHGSVDKQATDEINTIIKMQSAEGSDSMGYENASQQITPADRGRDKQCPANRQDDDVIDAIGNIQGTMSPDSLHVLNDRDGPFADKHCLVTEQAGVGIINPAYNKESIETPDSGRSKKGSEVGFVGCEEHCNESIGSNPATDGAEITEKNSSDDGAAGPENGCIIDKGCGKEFHISEQARNTVTESITASLGDLNALQEDCKDCVEECCDAVCKMQSVGKPGSVSDEDRVQDDHISDKRFPSKVVNETGENMKAAEPGLGGNHSSVDTEHSCPVLCENSHEVVNKCGMETQGPGCEDHDVEGLEDAAAASPSPVSTTPTQGKRGPGLITVKLPGFVTKCVDVKEQTATFKPALNGRCKTPSTTDIKNSDFRNLNDSIWRRLELATGVQVLARTSSRPPSICGDPPAASSQGPDTPTSTATKKGHDRVAASLQEPLPSSAPSSSSICGDQLAPSSAGQVSSKTSSPKAGKPEQKQKCPKLPDNQMSIKSSIKFSPIVVQPPDMPQPDKSKLKTIEFPTDIKILANRTRQKILQFSLCNSGEVGQEMMKNHNAEELKSKETKSSQIQQEIVEGKDVKWQETNSNATAGRVTATLDQNAAFNVVSSINIEGKTLLENNTTDMKTPTTIAQPELCGKNGVTYQNAQQNNQGQPPTTFPGAAVQPIRRSKRKSKPTRFDFFAKSPRMFLTQKQLRKIPVAVVKSTLLQSENEKKESSKTDAAEIETEEASSTSAVCKDAATLLSSTKIERRLAQKQKAAVRKNNPIHVVNDKNENSANARLTMENVRLKTPRVYLVGNCSIHLGQVKNDSVKMVTSSGSMKNTKYPHSSKSPIICTSSNSPKVRQSAKSSSAVKKNTNFNTGRQQRAQSGQGKSGLMENSNPDRKLQTITGWRYIPKLSNILATFEPGVTTCCFCRLPANHILGIGDLFGPYRPLADEVMLRHDSVNERLKMSPGRRTNDPAHAANGSPQVTIDRDESTSFITARVEEDSTEVDGGTVGDIMKAVTGSSHRLRTLQTVDHLLQDSSNRYWQNKQKLLDPLTTSPVLRIPGPKHECKLLPSVKYKFPDISDSENGAKRPQNEGILPNINSIVFMEPTVSVPHVDAPPPPLATQSRSEERFSPGSRRKRRRRQRTSGATGGRTLFGSESPSLEQFENPTGRQDCTSMEVSHRFSTSPIWTHGNCAVWADGVYAIRGQLYGLWDAARSASLVVCRYCGRTGATIACDSDKHQLGQSPIKAYHYPCALSLDLDMDWSTLRARKRPNGNVQST